MCQAQGSGWRRNNNYDTFALRILQKRKGNIQPEKLKCNALGTIAEAGTEHKGMHLASA